MCGIAGIITNSSKTDFRLVLKNMLILLKHRGPDYTGFWSDNEQAYLGFNRLSIVDLSDKANQPLFNEDNSLVLVLNGEIYNYLELRQRLSGLGHIFKSHSDAESVLHAFEEWGKDCLEHLRGMYAFVIWDAKKQELFLARDRIGIKPLYYLEADGIFLFSSELKGFNAYSSTGLWPMRLKEGLMDLYLNFPFIMDNQNTLIEGVKKLPPGHFAFYKNRNLTIKRYWELENKQLPKLNFLDALDKTEDVLKEAINCHFIGDVPIGLMLSGGLDSSVIGALALKCNKRIELALTTGHKDFALDERNYGRQVAAHLGLKHVELEIDPQEIADNLERFVWYFDDLSNIEFFYHIYMAKKVRELGLKVILVGQGADEVFGGYHIFKLSMFPFSILPSRLWNMCYYRLLTGKKFSKEYLKRSSMIPKSVFNYRKGVHNLCSDFELNCQLPNYNLVSEDKGFMSHSVESRVPFLDHKVVEFVYNLPQAHKLKGSIFSRDHEIIKYILRKIAARYLPESIAKRRKQGVGLSMEVIASDEIRVRECLLSSRSTVQRYFEKSKIEKLFKNYAQNMPFIFRLYVFEIWSGLYLKGQRQEL